ncbi:MAG TPA: hypothetical protein VGJ48_27220 [Pyrinomonadaceae bacterium]|jgi:hypothetical protein
MNSLIRLVRVPALITLGVTLLRLIGELRNWSPTFFNREAGGGGAIVGIAWLVPIFGIYFALKLSQPGTAPLKAGKTVLCAVAGLAAFFVIGFGGMRILGLDPNSPSLKSLVLFIVASVVSAIIAYAGSPALGKVLFAYGLAARIPVALVMLVAMFGNWGTHYDVAPPNFPQMSVFARWLIIGLVPQLTLWIAYTLAVGCLFGGIVLALFRRKTALQPA